MKFAPTLLALVCFATWSPSTTSAQEDVLPTITARVVTVKGDSVARWESLIKERVLESRARGEGFLQVYQVVRGTAQTFLIISPGSGSTVPFTDNWAAAVLDARASASHYTLQVYPELRTSTPDTVRPTAFVYERIRTVPPSRANDYYRWQRDELLPALRDAGVRDVRTARIAFGGNINTWLRFAFIDDFPTVNSGQNILAESMGAQQAQEMLNRGRGMTSSETDIIYSFRADLSYSSN